MALNIPGRSKETPESSTPPTTADGLRMRGSGQFVGGADPDQPLLSNDKYKVEFSGTNNQDIAFLSGSSKTDFVVYCRVTKYMYICYISK